MLLLVLLPTLLLLGVLPSCADYCAQIERSEVQARRRKPTRASPHMRVVIPYSLLDRLIARRLSKLEPFALAPPVVGLIVPALRRLRVVAKKLSLRPAAEGQVGFAVELVLRGGEQDWLKLRVKARIRPEVVDGAIVIGLRADDLRRVEPELGPAPRKAIANALRETLPAALLDSLSEEDLADLAATLIEYLSAEGYEALRDGLLKDLGEIAKLRLALPRLPIDALEVRSMLEPSPRLVVDVQSSLAVHTGLPADSGLGVIGDGGSPRALRVYMSGSMVAELGNWAIDNGQLPPRYDSDLEPDPKGHFRPRFDWLAGDERPMKIHVVSTEPQCVQLRIGARPRLRFVGQDLVFHLDDGQIEQVTGTWIVQLGVQFKRLGKGPMAFSKQRAKSMSLSLSGQELELDAVDALIDGQQMRLDLQPRWKELATSN